MPDQVNYSRKEVKSLKIKEKYREENEKEEATPVMKKRVRRSFGRLQQLNKLLEVTQFKKVEQPTNDFVQFEIVQKSNGPKQLDAETSALIYRNNNILNTRRVAEEDKVEIKPVKPQKYIKKKSAFRPPL